tara:strand:+ start:646 stop:906 length:261 start_codon:yes stop_codon:yes gene_type:complete
MKEIDNMLNTWVYNTIIRKQLRDLIIKYATEFEQNNCPECNESPSGKYRDEMNVDGMYCRACEIAWNINWLEQKPLYDTIISIKEK